MEVTTSIEHPRRSALRDLDAHLQILSGVDPPNNSSPAIFTAGLIYLIFFDINTLIWRLICNCCDLSNIYIDIYIYIYIYIYIEMLLYIYIYIFHVKGITFLIKK